MPIALRLLVPLRQWLLLFGALAAFLILKMGVRPLLRSLATPQGGIVTEITGAVPRTIVRGLLWVERQCESALSHFAHAGLAVGVAWLTSLAVLGRETYKEQLALARDTAEALGILRRQTLPRVAKAAAAPALNRARIADRRARRSISLTNTLRVRLGRSISANTKRLGALAAIVLGIDVLVKGRHAARHHRDHARTIPNIRDKVIPGLRAKDRTHDRALADQRARIGRLEKALGLGIIGALMYRILARVAPWLFCRNWKVLGRAICGMNANALSGLLALLLGAFVLSDLRRSANMAQDALEFVTGAVWGAASIGDRPSGRFTVD